MDVRQDETLDVYVRITECRDSKRHSITMTYDTAQKVKTEFSKILQKAMRGDTDDMKCEIDDNRSNDHLFPFMQSPFLCSRHYAK